MEPGSAISIKDVADLLFAARERIDFYWNFHVVVVIAVIGWLVSLKRSLTVPMKVLFSVVYSIAAAANFLGLYSAYTFAEALRTDLLRMSAGAPLTDTLGILERHSYLPHRLAALWVHLAIGISILLVAWFARLATEPAAAEATTSNPEEQSAHEKQDAV
jgi:hypothetical protein